MEPKTPPFELPLPLVAARGSVRLAAPARGRPAGTILVLVMAVLGLLLILGTVFITVTATDRASTSNVIRATQADLAAKSAINAAAEAIRRSLFDPSGQYVLTGGVRVGPQIQYTCLDNNNNPIVRNMPDYPSSYPDPRYRGKSCSANLTVGQYMDLPDPDFDYWLTSIVDGYNPPNSYEKYQSTDMPALGITPGAAVIRNVARIGVPIPPNPNEGSTKNPTINIMYGTRRDFRYPANCRNVPMFINNQPNPDLVDVDQDGIAEGIWCVVPITASGGEQWEAAYKVIDLSGLVNLNTAIRPVRPENVATTGGMSIGGEAVDLMHSSINPAETTIAKALGRYQTGAETNGFLYGPFITSLSPNNLGSPTTPGPYETIGFYNNDPSKNIDKDLKGTNTQMWSLLGVALNPTAAVYMNSFKLADEIEFRYRGGLSGRSPQAGKASDSWSVYQTGRSNVYGLLETVPNVDPGIVARPYLTALSSVANYMVGDPRSMIEGTGALAANVRDGTIRGTWTAKNPNSRKVDAQKSPPPKSLSSLLDDISKVPAPAPDQVEKTARINTATARQFRISMDNLVTKYLTSNTTDQKKFVLNELADGFRFALDGYLNTGNYRSFIGKSAFTSATDSNVMDQMAAHLAANLIALSDSDNSPVVFTYNGTSGSSVTVVGIPQFPVIQDVSDENDASKPDQVVTLFNPWDTDISPQTMVLMDDVDGGNLVELSPTATPAITVPSIPAYDSRTITLPGGKKFKVRGDPAATPPTNAKPVYLAHKKKVDGHYIVVDAWNRDLQHKPRPTRQPGTNIPDGSLTGPKGCTGLFSVDVAGVTPLLKCDIHLTKPHHSLLNGSYSKTNNPPFFTGLKDSSAYLPYRSRWTSPADINRIPTFGGVIPMTGTPPTLSYSGTITFADQATQCQISATQGKETGKINLLQPGVTTPQYLGGNLTMNCGYDKLTPGQRFFMFFSKIDPLTDGFGDPDISVGGKYVNPLARLENKIYGLININTAPASVLKFLPWTNDPTHNDQLVRPFGFVRNDPSAAAVRNDIAQKIIDYRNQLKRGVTGPPNTGTPGFLSIAELLNIPMVQLTPTPLTAYDLDYRAGNWWGAMDYATSNQPPSLATALPATSMIATGRIGPDAVRGDWAKRDLLFRNVCSMVTTRSDTFAVYVVIRSRNIVTNQVSSLRWVYAIVDRSNIRNSNDAPLVYGPFDNSK